MKKKRTLAVEWFEDPRCSASSVQIRLKGRWLSRLGFRAGDRVTLTPLLPGALLVSTAENEERIITK